MRAVESLEEHFVVGVRWKWPSWALGGARRRGSRVYIGMGASRMDIFLRTTFGVTQINGRLGGLLPRPGHVHPADGLRGCPPPCPPFPLQVTGAGKSVAPLDLEPGLPPARYYVTGAASPAEEAGALLTGAAASPFRYAG